jgi:hypothetical protein
MAEVQITIGLRREPGDDGFIFTVFQILLYDLFQKIIIVLNHKAAKINIMY